MKDMQRLHIVHTEASCGWGGQEIRTLTEARGMMERGHSVEIWAPEHSNIYMEAKRRGIPARALPIEFKTWRGWREMRAALKAARPDVVNTHSSSDSWLIALASLTLRDAPAVVRTRHISAPVPKNFATRWLYGRAARHVVTTGEELRATLIRENRLPSDRVTSVPTGIDVARFCPGDRAAAQRALGLDPANRYIGIVATLRSWKGHLYLIDAFAELVASDPQLQLLIVGDGPMRPNLDERVSARGLEGKVTFTGRQEAVEQWLQALDVFCLSSYANEGVPQAIVQAMLTGLPIVSTTIGAIGEAITNGATGLLVPPKDAAALAAALRRVLSDRALAERLAAAAREDALKRFTLPGMLSAMESIFRRVREDVPATERRDVG